jgi:3-methyladenine DNA glycosylase AlkD
MTVQEIRDRLQTLGNPQHAAVLSRFFKTGPGEYGEGDVFVGLHVPEIRKLAREYCPLPLHEAVLLLQSHIHEARLLALFILIRMYNRGDDPVRDQVYRAYLENTRFVNNWDLVDASAEHIIGAHLGIDNRGKLDALASSTLIWERRISIIATFNFIKRGEFADTLRISELLLRDREDLIHKAVGWMLREVGKRDMSIEEAFLKTSYRSMPRTMLRYAVEKFPETLRKQYLRGEI